MPWSALRDEGIEPWDRTAGIHANALFMTRSKSLHLPGSGVPAIQICERQTNKQGDPSFRLLQASFWCLPRPCVLRWDTPGQAEGPDQPHLPVQTEVHSWLCKMKLPPGASSCPSSGCLGAHFSLTGNRLASAPVLVPWPPALPALGIRVVMFSCLK